jgi:EAL domain-containing protein (putative c-di-GMP-specific phosphodiesterase class I)
VNFSAVQFYDGDTLKKNILDTLDRAELEPDQLVLEVTESIFMSRGHSVDAVLAELGSWGLQIAIDDFGTGYSNLAYIKRFAVHHIKIDQSFTRDLVEDATSRQLVTAIVQMAHSLNIKVIAEGVETQEQRDILFDLGCDEGQGYLFGRPMELSRLLEENRLNRPQVPDLC